MNGLNYVPSSETACVECLMHVMGCGLGVAIFLRSTHVEHEAVNNSSEAILNVSTVFTPLQICKLGKGESDEMKGV